jgi:hypothetical protein
MNLTAQKNRSIEARKIYAALALRGSNMSDWAATHSFKQSTVWKAVHNGHDGPLSRRILRTLVKDLPGINIEIQKFSDRQEAEPQNKKEEHHAK